MGQKATLFSEQEELHGEVERLWELASELPVQMIPLQEFDEVIDSKMWCGPEGITFRQFTWMFQRVQQANLAYPIILAAESWIMDGRTRLQKALLLNQTEIAAVRFPVTPEPDQRKSI